MPSTGSHTRYGCPTIAMRLRPSNTTTFSCTYVTTSPFVPIQFTSHQVHAISIAQCRYLRDLATLYQWYGDSRTRRAWNGRVLGCLASLGYGWTCQEVSSLLRCLVYERAWTNAISSEDLSLRRYLSLGGEARISCITGISIEHPCEEAGH